MEYTILNPDEATGGLICLAHIAEAMARHAATGFGKRNIHTPTLINLREKTSALIIDAIGAGDIQVYHHDGRPVRELPSCEGARSGDEYLLALATTKEALIAWGAARGDAFKIVDYEIEPTHSDLNQYDENGEVLRVVEKDYFRGYCFGPRYIDQESPQFQPSTAGSANDSKQRSDNWHESARTIADQCFDRDTACNCRDSLAGYAQRVMEEMQKRKIHGPRGRIDNPKTIQRDALQSDRWWKHKKK